MFQWNVVLSEAEEAGFVRPCVCLMHRNPNIVLTRQVLLEKLWDADGNFVDEHALTAASSRVRGKIETGSRQYIKTVYGMGYMWIGGMLK